MIDTRVLAKYINIHTCKWHPALQPPKKPGGTHLQLLERGPGQISHGMFILLVVFHVA